MQKRIFHLSTCNTCKRILSELNFDDSVQLIDVKTAPIGAEDLEELRTISGSYESLFNRRSRLYQSKGLKGKTLSEDEIKGFILEHYTFLKRPIIQVGNDLFIGNSKAAVQGAQEALDRA